VAAVLHQLRADLCDKPLLDAANPPEINAAAGASPVTRNANGRLGEHWTPRPNVRSWPISPDELNGERVPTAAIHAICVRFPKPAEADIRGVVF
jgi:hypothetical protein